MGEDVKRVYPGWMRDRKPSAVFWGNFSILRQKTGFAAGALREPFRFSRALFPGRERNNEAKRGVRGTKNAK
jgi:hypothetical protein